MGAWFLKKKMAPGKPEPSNYRGVTKHSAVTGFSRLQRAVKLLGVTLCAFAAQQNFSIVPTPKGMDRRDLNPHPHPGHEDAVARILLLAAGDSLSHAVRRTNRGACLRIFSRYGTARFASNFAVSRSSQPRPFCTMSSGSASRKLESFTISGNSNFARAARISATQAARRCQRLRDFAQRNTFFKCAGFAATIGAIK